MEIALLPHPGLFKRNSKERTERNLQQIFFFFFFAGGGEGLGERNKAEDAKENFWVSSWADLEQWFLNG